MGPTFRVLNRHFENLKAVSKCAGTSKVTADLVEWTLHRFPEREGIRVHLDRLDESHEVRVLVTVSPVERPNLPLSSFPGGRGILLCQNSD